ncbi:MAG TPA: O-antigen ligase family protein [Verrucomicrobiae bacterium]|nr:O-antigen ligase family protein [Verrucomicrobiae bacterium]
MKKPPAPTHPAATRITAAAIFAAAFGLFLGLTVVKFGNPVILDQIIDTPASTSDFLHNAWPLHWANWLLAVLAVIGAVLAVAKKPRWPGSRWLWVLPLVWFAWQVLSSAQSPYHKLTSVTLWQFAGCLACYFLGALVMAGGRSSRFLMAGLLAAFAFCLIRAVDQRLFEFPSERQFLVESQRLGWTNMPPDMFQQLQHENIIIHTNDVDIANPVIIAKYDKARVHGTLVYPNALAGIVLLLLPVAIVLVWQGTRHLRRATWLAAMGLTVFLGLAGLFWSGSKSGWLIALAIGAFWLCRLNWARRLKWLVVLTLVAGGLIVFGLRFQTYFAKGATSVGARFDYWHAAGRVVAEHPVFGTGPGTFQRPYALLKRPESEMARLVHNDYLEQFSDSGVLGGLAYAAWIGLLLWTIGRRVWTLGDWFQFAILAGLLGWFIQGFIEFSLFVPALAWTAFTLSGCLLGASANRVDKPIPAV